MVLAPVSARNCEVMGTLHGARVGGMWTSTYKDATPVSTSQRVTDSCVVFKRQGSTWGDAFLRRCEFKGLMPVLRRCTVVRQTSVLTPVII